MAIDPIYEKAAERAKNRSLDPASLERFGSCDFGDGVTLGSQQDWTGEEEIKLPLECVETTRGFSTVCGLLLALEAKKGKKYAGSWIKRGEVSGALPNIERKVDRLGWNCALVSPTSDDIGGPEGRIECLADLAVYSIKWLTYLMETRPTDFLKYVERIRNL